MSVPDAPDGTRASVSAQRLLGTYASGVAEATVSIAPDVVALWIFAGPGSDPPAPVVTGVETEIAYPCFAFPAQDFADGQLVGMAIVSPTVDESVTVAWGAPFGASWYVVGDTGPRFILDPALAASLAENGATIPLTGLLVGGSDGTDFRALSVDTTGKLIVSGGAFPPVYAAPGGAPPTDALAVGGTDGADFRMLAVDATGHPLTIDQNLKNVVGVDGVAAPSDSVAVGGSDGALLRVLAVDAAGHPLTIDQTLKLAIAASATAVPADTVQVGGTDGTNLRPFAVDASGHLVPKDAGIQSILAIPTNPNPTVAAFVGFTDGTDLRVPITSKSALPYMIPSAPSELTADRPPNELQWASVVNEVANTVVVAAPGAGKALRLFFVYSFPQTATSQCFVSCGSAGILLAASLVANGALPVPVSLPLTGLLCGANSGVTLVVSAGTCGATVGYTIETV